MQLILTLLFYVLLVGIFVMVYLMWRTSVKRTAKLEGTLIGLAEKNADTSEKNAETARRLSRILEEQPK